MGKYLPKHLTHYSNTHTHTHHLLSDRQPDGWSSRSHPPFSSPRNLPPFSPEALTLLYLVDGGVGGNPFSGWDGTGDHGDDDLAPGPSPTTHPPSPIPRTHASRAGNKETGRGEAEKVLQLSSAQQGTSAACIPVCRPPLHSGMCERTEAGPIPSICAFSRRSNSAKYLSRSDLGRGKFRVKREKIPGRRGKKPTYRQTVPGLGPPLFGSLGTFIPRPLFCYLSPTTYMA